VLAARLEFLDQAELDRMMRDMACHAWGDPITIPRHMPARHWWWWLPGDPPG
jgi:hypothetical protein